MTLKKPNRKRGYDGKRRPWSKSEVDRIQQEKRASADRFMARRHEPVDPGEKR